MHHAEYIFARINKHETTKCHIAGEFLTSLIIANNCSTSNQNERKSDPPTTTTTLSV